ncbi:MAG TPA: prolyl oligopeptidase family serine peptidase, partial [Longimicrobiales bacterium]
RLERYGLPTQVGGALVYTRFAAGAPVLYLRSSPGAEARVLLDPATLKADGPIAFTSLSPDGRYLAYAVSQGGADWQEVHVLDVATGKPLPDRLRWVRYTNGMYWTADSRGFFYSRFPAPPDGQAAGATSENHELRYHLVGAAQDDDRLIYSRPDQPRLLLGGWLTADGRYLVIVAKPGPSANNTIYLLDLKKATKPDVTGKPVPLFGVADARYVLLDHRGSVFYVRTNRDAPRWRIVAVDLRQPQPAGWKTIVPEGPDALEASTDLYGDRLVVPYVRDGHPVVALYRLDGKPAGELRLPGIGTVTAMSGKSGQPDMFYVFSSFLYPPTVFHYDLRSGKNEVFLSPALAFDATRYESRQVMYGSKDGTRVPLFLAYRKDLPRDGAAPTLLQAYGGFAVTQFPAFSASALVWLEQGGIWAQAAVRGGGELGEDWHQAGMKEHKQNTFDDVIAAAEYLVKERYTSPARLALRGSSNGGLTASAAAVQRPDLFGVVLPDVGPADMLRFPRFTAGAYWVPELGAPDTPEMFRALLAYSPLHNVKAGTCYPAMLVSTAERDDRVVPLHSYKLVAALQAAQGCHRPILLRVDSRAGHQGLSSAALANLLRADILAFAWKGLGMSKAVGAGR